MTGLRRKLQLVVTSSPRLSGVLGLRAIALGGRFIFVLVAAHAMAAQDFGRFGLLQGLCALVSAFVGVEAYQILLRRIRLAPEEEAREVRGAYGVMTIGATLMAAVAGLVCLSLLGWSGITLLLGVIIVAGEHLSLEVYRNLINEYRSFRAVLSTAARSGMWGIAIPALELVGLGRPWSLELVLLFWVGGLIVSLIVGAPLWSAFCHGVSYHVVQKIFRETIRACQPWVISVFAWRVVEHGGRFITAWQVSEAAAGTFALLSMIASVGFIAQKGVIEPIYFPRLTGGDDVVVATREFTLLTWLVCGGATVVAIAGFASLFASYGRLPTTSDMVTFGTLLVAFDALTVSQVHHFELYRNHQDRKIRNATVAGAVVTVIFSTALGEIGGMAGISIGTAMGAVTILGMKALAAYRVRQAATVQS